MEDRSRTRNGWHVRQLLLALVILAGCSDASQVTSPRDVLEAPKGSPGRPSKAPKDTTPPAPSEPASDTTPEGIAPFAFPVIQNGDTLYLRYSAPNQQALNGGPQTRVLIAIHGTGRTAPSYFTYAQNAANSAGSDALVIAPQFLITEDLQTATLPTALYWTSTGWRDGAQSLNDPAYPRPFRISSFSVLDRLLAHLADGRFPNLRTIVIFGNSAGGIMTQRYALSSNRLPTGISVEFAPSNAGTFAYLDPDRWDGTRFRPLTTEEQSLAPRWNSWRYGLSDLHVYPSAVGAATMRAQYKSRSVAYLIGQYDNDPSHPQLDVSAAASWQGAHRYERVHRYKEHLTRFYGPLPSHVVVVVPGAGHEGREVLASPTTWPYLFQDRAQSLVASPVTSGTGEGVSFPISPLARRQIAAAGIYASRNQQIGYASTGQ